MSEKELKFTDLDYAIGDHHMQMLKAALPYMGIPKQRALSLFVKWNELMRTMEFFNENGDGMMSVCSLDEDHVSPVDMLSAVRPYASEQEQELIDMMTRFISAGKDRPTEQGPILAEQLLAMLPPEQRSRFETIQLMMQAMAI